MDDDDFEVVSPTLDASRQNSSNSSAANGKQKEVIYDQEVASKLEDLDAEIESVQKQIAELQKLKDSVLRERRNVYNTYLKSLRPEGSGSIRKLGTDYTVSTFSWSDDIRLAAMSVFGIPSFRFCQGAVINAALDGRNAVVVMPTGGGKSLCYQLPAILKPGLILVVSPLISLMTDQVLHLQEVGIQSELLCGSTSREDSNAILKQIRDGSASTTRGSGWNQHQTDGIKLLYVTPERIAKSKTCLSALQSAYEQGRLSRIVIDEARE